MYIFPGFSEVFEEKDFLFIAVLTDSVRSNQKLQKLKRDCDNIVTYELDWLRDMT